MLIESGGVYLNTTLSAGFEAAPGLRFGAGFIWGFANLKLANANMSMITVATRPTAPGAILSTQTCAPRST